MTECSVARTLSACFETESQMTHQTRKRNQTKVWGNKTHASGWVRRVIHWTKSCVATARFKGRRWAIIPETRPSISFQMFLYWLAFGHRSSEIEQFVTQLDVLDSLRVNSSNSRVSGTECTSLVSSQATPTVLATFIWILSFHWSWADFAKNSAPDRVVLFANMSSFCAQPMWTESGGLGLGAGDAAAEPRQLSEYDDPHVRAAAHPRLRHQHQKLVRHPRASPGASNCINFESTNKLLAHISHFFTRRQSSFSHPHRFCRKSCIWPTSWSDTTISLWTSSRKFSSCSSVTIWTWPPASPTETRSPTKSTKRVTSQKSSLLWTGKTAETRSRSCSTHNKNLIPPSLIQTCVLRFSSQCKRAKDYNTKTALITRKEK